jgi:hypothetical protein
LLVTEEEEKEFDQIINSLPYPITCIFSRLGTVDCLKLDNRRLNYILDTAEAASRFLGVLVLCLCRDQGELSGDAVHLNIDSLQKLKKPTWGYWIEFSREGLKWLAQQDTSNPLAGQLVNFFFKRIPKESPAIQAMGRLLTIRNDIVHKNEPILYAPQLQDLCEKTYADLKILIKALGFLADYNLSCVDQINVWKRRHHEPDFSHSLVRISAGHCDFRAAEKSYKQPLETRSVIFRQGDTGPYLNLDPLLIYDYKSGAAPDLFFFNGMKNPQAINYVACKQGIGFDSGNKTRAAELAEEMQNLMRVLAPDSGGRS